MNGNGRVFKRGSRWWVAYYVRGKEFRESAGKTEAEAKRLLKKRMREVHGDRFIGPQEEKVLINELLDHLITHLKNKGARSIPALVSGLKPIREDFGFDRAIDITATRIEQYISEMLNKRKAPATINRGLQGLRQGYNLFKKEGRLNRVPHFGMLHENNARQGFFEKPEFEAVSNHLPCPINDIALLAYLSGWRKGEITPLKWNQVDRAAKEIRIPTSKNGCGRTLPLEGQLTELVERRWTAREVTLLNGETYLSPYVFHQKGHPIGNFRKAWNTACKKAGCSGKLFHDLRRTAVRNMIRAGVPQSVAMTISGHKTISMFLRYNITSQDDQRKALIATQEHISSLPSQPKVVRLGEASA